MNNQELKEIFDDWISINYEIIDIIKKYPEVEDRLLLGFTSACNLTERYISNKNSGTFVNRRLTLNNPGYLKVTNTVCHLWDGKDTLCKLWSKGIINKEFSNRYYRNEKQTLFALQDLLYQKKGEWIYED
jgi:hypothetical protein